MVGAIFFLRLFPCWVGSALGGGKRGGWKRVREDGRGKTGTWPAAVSRGQGERRRNTGRGIGLLFPVRPSVRPLGSERFILCTRPGYTRPPPLTTKAYKLTTAINSYCARS